MLGTPYGWLIDAAWFLLFVVQVALIVRLVEGVRLSRKYMDETQGLQEEASRLLAYLQGVRDTDRMLGQVVRNIEQADDDDS